MHNILDVSCNIVICCGVIIIKVMSEEPITKTDLTLRIEKEKEELQEKFDRLGEFLESNDFDEINKDQQRLLIEQYYVMGSYLKILNDRLDLL